MEPDRALLEKFPYLGEVQGIAEEVCDTLVTKEAKYKGSWKKRGGTGAFMVMCRKWDRIEGISEAEKYDIFKCLLDDIGSVDGIEEDIKDLIGYLLLILAWHKVNQCTTSNSQT